MERYEKLQELRSSRTSVVSRAGQIDALLGDGRFEHARRVLLSTPERDRTRGDLIQLHDALFRLGDLHEGRRLLEPLLDRSPDDVDVLQRLATDCRHLAAEQHYRRSAEGAAGLTLDQYAARYRELADAYQSRADVISPPVQQAETPQQSPPVEYGQVAGCVTWPDGQSAANIRLALGVVDVLPRAVGVPSLDIKLPATANEPHIFECVTSEDGRFEFLRVPTGRSTFLAVQLDELREPISTRFIAHNIDVRPGETARVSATITHWQSASKRPAKQLLPDSLHIGESTYQSVARQSLWNPFDFAFSNQRFSMPLPKRVIKSRLVAACSDAPAKCIPVQYVAGEAVFFAELHPKTEREYVVYQADADLPAISSPLALTEQDGSLCIDTGVAQFRIVAGTDRDTRPPLLAVRGQDEVWRGRGELRLPVSETIAKRVTTIELQGPVECRVAVAYTFESGSQFHLTFTAHAGERYLLVDETSTKINGAAFVFHLDEFGGGQGRGYLHWKGERGDICWSTLTAEDRELARLQESVPWWIPPCGFGYALSPDGLDENDFIAVFTRRRGDWIDRDFEAISCGPGDSPDARELDWPYPEMVGSTISMITAQTTSTGDAAFHFPFFDGRRHWGILASTVDRNDGPSKELAAVQHKTSSPTLQQFASWRLDEPDGVERPHVMTTRGKLVDLRHRRESDVFGPIWDKVKRLSPRQEPVEALRFAVDGDPLLAWKKKQQLLFDAAERTRLTLLGRDVSDVYSPVGGRAITPLVEEYDLIVASGVFTADEERLVRAYFIAMGHLYMTPDFMNWKFGSRNANFEADRVDIVGTIGVAFQGNPDAAIFIEHAIDLMESSLNVYCTPGSGKWYENPACYYLRASKCRMNLMFHLHQHGLWDATKLPRLKDFLNWGVLLLMPPSPAIYEQMRDGLSDQQYAQTTKVRRIPPIGDHAHLGPWVPEHYALASKMYRATDPDFANRLLWAYQAGGCDGGVFGNMPLLYTATDEVDHLPAPPASLASRRLQGFGAVFRDNFATADEFYLLLKQGPGGYRYHRTEGSIILFANGKPLVYDGGEAGETWRHSTLSFHDTHMPLAPGHVERFITLPGLEFCQGVHPKAISPGEPVFLSDICHQDLVKVAHDRFREPNPAVTRSIWRVRTEYVVMHDALNLPMDVTSYWHLQVVADSHLGNVADGLLFKGRYGTDLQLLMPNQTFDTMHIEQLPMLEHYREPADTFSTRHVEFRGQTGVKDYVAVLRPFNPHGQPLLKAELIESAGAVTGIRVWSDDGAIDDRLLFNRSGTLEIDGISFTGKYAARLSRNGGVQVLLLGEGCIVSDGVTIQSTHAAVSFDLASGEKTITCGNAEDVTIRGRNNPR